MSLVPSSPPAAARASALRFLKDRLGGVAGSSSETLQTERAGLSSSPTRESSSMRRSSPPNSSDGSPPLSTSPSSASSTLQSHQHLHPSSASVPRLKMKLSGVLKAVSGNRSSLLPPSSSPPREGHAVLSFSPSPPPSPSPSPRPPSPRSQSSPPHLPPKPHSPEDEPRSTEPLELLVGRLLRRPGGYREAAAALREAHEGAVEGAGEGGGGLGAYLQAP